MREIKFRAWDRIGKVMDNAIQLQYSHRKWEALSYGHQSKQLKDFILMQYTGLKDKNEVEIYEGDIVSDGNLFEIIHWHTSKVYDYKEEEPIYMDGWGVSREYINEFNLEIIGNIYENEDLIKEKA